jgi:hypothetical protein
MVSQKVQILSTAHFLQKLAALVKISSDFAAATAHQRRTWLPDDRVFQ